MATVVYGLQAASFIVGITYIVAVILAYMKRDSVRGTWLASHFRWQINTFWFGLLWTVIGSLTMVFLVGWVIIVLNTCWIVYRIAVGWMKLSEERPAY